MTAYIDIKKLKAIVDEKNWDQLLADVKPKYFVKQESRELPGVDILAEICLILISKTTPDVVKILCLKCLGNCCFDGYKCRTCTFNDTEPDKYQSNLYTVLTENVNLKMCDDTYDSQHFPYDGVTEWAMDYITVHDISMNDLNDNKLNILRLSVQFLSNLFTYACKNVTSTKNTDIPKYLNCNNLKQAIMSNMESDHTSLANASCIFVYNALTVLDENYFTDDEKTHLYSQLLKPIKQGFASATDSMFYLLCQPNVFEVIYNNMIPNEKLDLLEIIYDKLWNQSICETLHTDFNPILRNDAVEFLALTFCEKSDLILKTVDSYTDNINPTEVILILNILGLLTAVQYKILDNAKRLIINCKYLLMSLHMMGKESDNYFTPITNLSQVAPNALGKSINVNSTIGDAVTSIKTTDPQDHPAYGFKVGVIKVIGNMVYKNKIYQDLFREIDGIPLLLDCCNIDARNPLILQWTIFALKNLSEANLENQEIIRNCKRKGLVDNSVLEEMGLTLHEDAEGKSIRIAPLRNNCESASSSKIDDRNQ